jgi:hypothetical protein
MTVYSQVPGFEKLYECDLSETLEEFGGGLSMSKDTTRFVSFYDSEKAKINII